jgi:hypothetical protein
MDFIVQIPTTKHGKDAIHQILHILVFVDRLSRMQHFAATHTTVTPEDIARLCLHEVFRLHGLPRKINADRDTRSPSNYGQKCVFCWAIGRVSLRLTIPKRVDRQKELTGFWRTCFGHYVDPVLDDWDEHLDAVKFSVNNAWRPFGRPHFT